MELPTEITANVTVNIESDETIAAALAGAHAGGDAVAQFFTYKHLPPHLADVSRSFASLAARIVETVPRGPERTVALRKLLEGKDAAVRAVLAKATAA